MCTATKREEQDASAGSARQADDTAGPIRFQVLPVALGANVTCAAEPQVPDGEDTCGEDCIHEGGYWYAFII